MIDAGQLSGDPAIRFLWSHIASLEQAVNSAATLLSANR